MASSKKVDLCMFCGDAPCTCNKAAPKIARVPRPKSEPKAKPEKIPVTVAPKVDVRAAMKKQSAPPAPATPQETIDLNVAIRALAPILHADERVRYQDIINYQPSIQERREAWKARTR